MTQGNLSLHIRGNIGEIRFSHPKANSLTGRLLSELARAIEDYGSQSAVKVIALSSEGSGSFCAGASFDEFQQITNSQEGEAFFSGFANVILAIRNAPKFVVARVQGKVVGGGVGLVAAADYALASSDAAARLSEFELGIGPFTIGPAVQRKLGVSAFSAMSIDCSWRDARWLLDHGLYCSVSEDTAALDANFEGMLQRLAAASPEASAEMKRMFWHGSENFPELLLERARISGRLILSRRERASS